MRGHVGCGGSIALALLGASSVAIAGGALDKPAFTASPSELLAAAKAAPAGDWPAVVLYEQKDTSFDDRGRATRRQRWIYVVRTEDGIDDWGTATATWNPSYQNRPTLRARVIGLAGDVDE